MDIFELAKDFLPIALSVAYVLQDRQLSRLKKTLAEHRSVDVQLMSIVYDIVDSDDGIRAFMLRQGWTIGERSKHAPKSQ